MEGFAMAELVVAVFLSLPRPLSGRGPARVSSHSLSNNPIAVKQMVLFRICVPKSPKKEIEMIDIVYFCLFPVNK